MNRHLAIGNLWQPVATLLLACTLNISATTAQPLSPHASSPATSRSSAAGSSLTVVGTAQSASLEAHNVPIDKLLPALARAFGFSLQYPIPRDTLISISLHNASLEQILARALRHHGFAFAPAGETMSVTRGQLSGKLWVWSGPPRNTAVASQPPERAEPVASHAHAADNFFHPDASMRMDAIERLAQAPAATALPYLVQAMSDPNLHVRKAALEVAARLRSENASGLLIDALHDADAKVRELAADLLGGMSDAGAEAALAQARRDPAPAVRAAARGHLSLP